MTRDEVVAKVKEFVGRNYTGIDDTIVECMNSAVELFGTTISAVYDEQEWVHTFTSSDTTNRVSNFALPTGTKYILDATIIDPTGDEDIYYTMDGRSPVDAYEIDRLHGRRARPGFYTGGVSISGTETMTWNTFRDHVTSPVSRVDQDGIPRWYWRVGNNVHIFPRNSVNEEGWELRIMLAMKPAILTTNTTNTITDNYPYALAHFAAGILWGTRFKDQQAANNHYLIAGQLLNSVASDQELSKLMNIKVVRA